jgi:hypothetical protein
LHLIMKRRIRRESDWERSWVRGTIAIIIGAAVLAALAGSDRPAAGRPTASPSVAERPQVEPAPAGSSPGPTVPAILGTIASIPPGLAAAMRGTTWHPGCPVSILNFRLLTLSYWGVDGELHEGPMVVNARVAKDVVWVFRRLFQARFPIQQIALASEYRPTDDPNTKVSITASFNCRPVVTPAGPGTTFSMHSYGLAIDINPLQNPFVAADGYVQNWYARLYRNLAREIPGMIHEADVVVRSFERIGWRWGGNWSTGKDYMHFSLNGR